MEDAKSQVNVVVNIPAVVYGIDNLSTSMLGGMGRAIIEKFYKYGFPKREVFGTLFFFGKEVYDWLQENSDIVTKVVEEEAQKKTEQVQRRLPEVEIPQGVYQFVNPHGRTRNAVK